MTIVAGLLVVTFKIVCEACDIALSIIGWTFRRAVLWWRING